MITMKRFIVLVAAFATLNILIAPVSAQTKVAKTAVPAAVRFAQAGETWGQVQSDRKALAKAITANRLSEVHDLAFSLRDGVVTLPYKSAGLPKAKQTALSTRVASVAALAEELHQYADANNAAKAKETWARLQTALSGIAALYPADALPLGEAKPMTAAERALFLTPGGLYTEADIKANGNTSAFQKYASVVPAHDTQVKKGDRVCPISETRPNPQLKWIVGGKEYTFCCPPCIGEFVAKAKKTPGAIKDPSAYVKQ